MLRRRTSKPADDFRFLRSCNVFLEADGDRVIVVRCFNHGGLTAEIPDTAEVSSRHNANELGHLVLKALQGCVWQPEFNYHSSKLTDWPAFRASGEPSVAQFERLWKRIDIRGANENNITWIVEAPTPLDFSLRLTASVAPATDEAGLGAAVLYVFDASTKLTSQ